MRSLQQEMHECESVGVFTTGDPVHHHVHDQIEQQFEDFDVKAVVAVTFADECLCEVQQTTSFVT